MATSPTKTELNHMGTSPSFHSSLATSDLFSLLSVWTTQNGTDSNSNLTKTHLHTDIDEYLQQLSDQMAVSLLPAILIIGIIMVISLIGNSLVFYVYLTKFNPSSTRTAILALAMLDLLASCIAMPGEMSDLRYSYNFRSDAFCKCIRMATTTVLMASGLTLLVVAVDRYRRICHPMGEQFTPGNAKKGAMLCFGVACLLSVPSVIIYGESKVPTSIEGVYGLECSIDQTYHEHILPLINNILQAVIFLVVFVSILVLYILLGRVVRRQKRFRQSVRKTSNQQEDRDHSITDGTRDSAGTPGSPVSPVPVMTVDGPFNHQSANDQVEEVTRDRKKSILSTVKMTVFPKYRKSSSVDIRTLKTTFMLFLITLFFVISFLPHLILKALQAVKKDYPSSSSTSEIVTYNVFVRSYFFNNVANCFIYGFCSPKFRRESKKIVMKLLCCGKKK